MNEWVNRTLFPFESKWFEIDGQQMHYVDEGSGPILLFVHGTPEWSFGFRDLIAGLRGQFRCIAPDHLGFGLSDKNKNTDYRCEAHARRLEQFIEILGLRDVSLVANDFGGGFALNYAIHHPDNINRIFLFNTWMRSLKKDRHFSMPARLMHTWLGRQLYLRFNLPVQTIMPAAFGDKRKLTEEVHRHYRMALPSANTRWATFALTGELLNASDWWQSLWDRSSAIEKKPIHFFWGLKDNFVPPSELDRWLRRFPKATVQLFDDAGHFVQEEKPAEMIETIVRLMRHSKE